MTKRMADLLELFGGIFIGWGYLKIVPSLLSRDCKNNCVNEKMLRKNNVDFTQG